jgi:KilA-N domain
MALDQTKDLAGILITANPGNSPIKAFAGRYGGTYVCKELVYAYASWIGPAFHLPVISVEARNAGRGGKVMTVDARAQGYDFLSTAIPTASIVEPTGQFTARDRATSHVRQDLPVGRVYDVYGLDENRARHKNSLVRDGFFVCLRLTLQQSH